MNRIGTIFSATFPEAQIRPSSQLMQKLRMWGLSSTTPVACRMANGTLCGAMYWITKCTKSIGTPAQQGAESTEHGVAKSSPTSTHSSSSSSSSPHPGLPTAGFAVAVWLPPESLPAC
eukprot:TRINITY_DN75030_c0_g1_i1.p2 TRINITY_DN75030_c0_g1~~TRINITY_DN75030_c0_g1_i1.p2  ORF type:complete len:118 (+),score=18.19 TRINITY_DN75030_c0_g1_i1:151-504(+)